MKHRIYISLVCLACFQRSYSQSPAEAQVMAQKIITCVERQDAESLSAMFHIPAMIAILKTKSRAANIPEIMDGASEHIPLIPFANSTMRQSNGGSFDLLRSYEKNGRQHLLFRIIAIDRNFNYQDYELIKTGDTVKLADVMNYTTGDLLSTSLAAVMDRLLPDNQSVSGIGPQDYLNYMRKMAGNKDYGALKDMYERLPDSMQRTKDFLEVYVLACRNISPADFVKSLEKFSALFPDAPNVYISMMDGYGMAGDFKKAMKAIDKVDELTGGDPFLNFHRGTMYMMQGKDKEGMAYLEKAYAYYPDLGMNVEAMVLLSFKNKEAAKAKKIFTTYKKSKKFNKSIGDYLEQQHPELLH